MTVKFQVNLRIVVFHYCDDVEDAKKKFQWRYGYWPSDSQIVEVTCGT